MRRNALATAALTVVASLWCVLANRTSRQAWRVPVDCGAHSLYTLATLKAAHDEHVTPLGLLGKPELGAPHGARQDSRLALAPGRPAATLFSPMYFQRMRLDRVSIELSQNDKHCLIGAKWLDSAALPPLWVGATLNGGD